jgi:hypothetical protein
VRAPAKRLLRVIGVEGSNPSPSAIIEISTSQEKLRNPRIFLLDIFCSVTLDRHSSGQRYLVTGVLVIYSTSVKINETKRSSPVKPSIKVTASKVKGKGAKLEFQSRRIDTPGKGN